MKSRSNDSNTSSASTPPDSPTSHRKLGSSYSEPSTPEAPLLLNSKRKLFVSQLLVRNAEQSFGSDFVPDMTFSDGSSPSPSPQHHRRASSWKGFNRPRIGGKSPENKRRHTSFKLPRIRSTSAERELLNPAVANFVATPKEFSVETEFEVSGWSLHQ